MTLMLLGMYSGVVTASGIHTEEFWTWVVRWFVMQMGGDWS